MNDKKSIHISWIVGILSLGFTVGVAGSLLFKTLFLSSATLFIIALCMLIISLKINKLISFFLVLFCGFCLGLIRGVQEVGSIKRYEKFFNTAVVVTGIVATDPSIAIDGDVLLRLKNVVIDDTEMEGELWVDTTSNQVVQRSDRLTVEGKITKGFGSIPAAMYRARVNMIDKVKFSDVGRDVRDKFSESIRKGIKEPEASLATGFLVGQKSSLPEKLTKELQLLGLTHIVVASGYNLTILVRIARRILEKISRFAALSGALLFVWGFLQVTGNSASMVRASLVTVLSLVAWYFGRKIHPFVLLSFVAALTVYVRPSYAWGDIGWLLSFTSFVGVIILSPLIKSYFFGTGGNHPAVTQIVIETLSAQIFTIPIIIYIFQQYSPLSFIANIIVVPLVALAMLLTLIAGIVGILVPYLAGIFAFPATAVLTYMTTVISKLAEHPASSREVAISKATLIVGYVAIAVFCVFIKRRTQYEFGNYNVIE